MRRRDGFILIAALWTVAVISVAMLQFGLSARSQRLTINNRTELLQARIAAEGAFRTAHADLARLLQENQLPHESWLGGSSARVDTTRFSGGRVVTRMSDASSMLHPLGLDVERLKPFFLELGRDSVAAYAAAIHVAGSQSSRGVLLLSGCAGAGVAEGGTLQPLPPDVHSLIEQALPIMLCVGSMPINVQTADRVVLMSLPGMSDQAVHALILRRDRGELSSALDVANDIRGADRDRLLNSAGPLLAASSTRTSAVYVSIMAQVDASPNSVWMDAVLSRSGGSVHTVWRQVR
jgi:type II secretory pathway component PulK